MASKDPGHYTAHGTRKFQANGPVEWSKVFRSVAGRDGREGEGIRAALAYAVAHADAFARWAESHISAWAPATTATISTKGKAPKAAPKAPRAPRAPKAPKAAPKAPKAAPKAPKAKAPEQLKMEEV